jgi:hypothetical protein
MEWIAVIIIVSLVTISAQMDAVMDTLWHHYDKSIFRDMDRMFWDPKISWRNKYIDHKPSEGRIKWNILGITINKPVQISDGWHIAKTIKIICLMSATTLAYFAQVVPVLEDNRDSFVLFIALLTVLGTIRNSVFSLFYDKLLIDKNT